MPTFAKILSEIPRNFKTDGIKVMVALLTCAAISPEVAVATAELKKTLRLHLRSRTPGNLTDVLRKAVPHVEPVRGDGRTLRWWITPDGVGRLAELTQMELFPQSNAVVGLSFENLHSLIYGSSQKLLLDEHYAEAVGAAMKHLNMLVRNRTDRRSDEGVAMMHQVFAAEPNGHVRLQLQPSIVEMWQRDAQDGFKFLMAGAQQYIANVHKHGHLSVTNVQSAMELLSMLSFLARQVDAAQKLESTDKRLPRINTLV